MKKSRKLLSLFLAVMMISSMFASFDVFAKNESYTYDDSVVIADFNTKAKIDASGVRNPTYTNSFVPSVDYAWGDGETTLKVPQVGSQSYCMPIPATAVSGKYLRVRYYIPNIADGQTVKINMLLMAEVHNTNLGSYVCVNFDTQKTGWNEDVFPISSSITAKGFMLAVGGWNDTLATGSTVYLDKISICGKHDYINSDLGDGVFIDNGYIRGPIGTWGSAHDMGAQRTTVNSRDGSPYVNFTVDANTDRFYFIHYTSATYGNTALDLSGYKYLNAWVYSPSVQDGGVVIELNGTPTWYLDKINFTGWKLYTFTLTDSQKTTLANTTRLGLASTTSWTGQFTSTGTFGIDKLWFSNEPVSAVNDGYVLNEFSTPGAFVSKHSNQTMVSKSYQNPHLYDTHARLINETSVERYLFTTGTTAADDVQGTTVSNYKYLNILMYNPEIKYYKDTTTPYKFNVVFRKTNNDGTISNYGARQFSLDWTGWKVLSVAKYDEMNTRGFDSVTINIGGWSATSWDNGSSYIDIDAVWLSNSNTLPTTFTQTNQTYTNGAEGFVLDTNKYTFNGNIHAANAAEAVKVYDKDLNKLTLNTDYTVSANYNELRVQPNAAGTYTVVIDGLTPAYPAKKSGRMVNKFTLTNTDVPVVSTEKSCNVRYRLPSGYSASTLVAAEYADSELVQVATAAWSSATNSAVISFETAPTKGNKVKFMYLADMDSLYPLYVAEEVTVTDQILVLAIGNSFSQDAMYELKNIAAADGVDIDAYNCYVGGRPLQDHYDSWNAGAVDYTIQPNGDGTGTEKTSSKELVSAKDWNYIILQGTTHASKGVGSKDAALWTDDGTIWQNMANDIATLQPAATRLVHGTWAPYETASAAFDSGVYADGTPDSRGAYTAAVLDRYELAASKFSTTSGTYLPTAVAVDYLIRHYGFAEVEGTLDSNQYAWSNASNAKSVYRDSTCHLTSNVGRVLAGLVWYEMITGTPATQNSYTRATLTDAEMTMIKEAAHYACQNYKTYDPASIIGA